MSFSPPRSPVLRDNPVNRNRPVEPTNPVSVDDIEQTIDELAVADEARVRYSMLESHQALTKTRQRLWHHYYAPLNGDQWPEDLDRRPGMIHVTDNIIQPVVDTEARLESLPPRMSLVADRNDVATRQRAQAAEKLLKHYLDLSGWDTWLFELCQTRAVYALGFLKPFWNKAEKRPDVEVIQQPGNLRVGWGTSDFQVIDWTIYEYGISPVEALRRYKDIEVIPAQRMGEPPVILRNGNHSDPLETSPVGAASNGTDYMLRPTGYMPSDYEKSQLRVWDYWYKDDKNKIWNAILLEGVVVAGPNYHPEYLDVPYIPIEFDHEPGSPDGLSLVQNLIDLQIELNRAMSHFSQLIADEVDPSWQMNADSVPAGMVPRGGEILATGGENQKIEPIQKPVNQIAINLLITEIFQNIHFTTGLADILFGISPGTRMPGRSMELQIESANNRVDPRRNRLYRGLYQLLIFWTYMLEKINPKFEVTVAADDGTEQTEMMGAGDLVRGLRIWRFVAPPITPQDLAQLTTRLVNQLGARMISLEGAMDELGIDNPIDMLQQVEAEHMNPRLYPGDTQAALAVYQAMLQLLPQLQQAGMQIPGLTSGPGAAAPPGGQSADQMAAAGMGQSKVQAQGAQPTLGPQDNQSAPPQPMSQPGSPPPPGGPLPKMPPTAVALGQPGSGASTLQNMALRHPIQGENSLEE